MTSEEALRVLGVPITATDDQITDAYNKAVAALGPNPSSTHPDARNLTIGDYTLAYDVLRDIPWREDLAKPKETETTSNLFSRCLREEFSEYVGLWTGIGCNRFLIFFYAPVLVLLLPSYLLFIPIHRTLWPDAEWTKQQGKMMMVVVNILAAVVIASPYLVYRELESRFGTDKLCQICGRPGKEVEYGETTDKVFVRVYCPTHESLIPASITVDRNAYSDSDTPHSNAVAGSTFSFIYWLVCFGVTGGLCAGSAIRRFLMLMPSLLIIAAIVVRADWAFLSTLFSP